MHIVKSPSFFVLGLWFLRGGRGRVRSGLGGGGGGGGTGGTGGGGTGNVAGVACGDAAPWVDAVEAAQVTLTVDAASPGAAWSRFYEGAVATDHANTILSARVGAQRAERAQEGARRGRVPLRALPRHPEPRHRRVSGRPRRRWRPRPPPTTGRASIRCTTRSWRRACGRSSRSASRRPRSRRTRRRSRRSSGTTACRPTSASRSCRPPPTRRRRRPGITGRSSWPTSSRHLEERYGADEVRDQLVLRGLERGDLDVRPRRVRLQRAVLQHRARPAARRSAGQGRRPGRQRRQLAQRDPGADRLRDSAHPDVKLDFITYHHYGKDTGPNSDAGGFVNFKKTLFTLIANKGFTGEVINDEWGPGYDPELSRDTEAAASFIAKSVHFIGTDTSTRLPTMYGYWTLSDIYEEMNTGSATAYREGNYGLLLKGDPNIPASFDLAKPAFNALPHAAHDDRHDRAGDGRHRGRDRQRRRRGRHAGRGRQLHPDPRLQPRQQLRHRDLGDDVGQRCRRWCR